MSRIRHALLAAFGLLVSGAHGGADEGSADGSLAPHRSPGHPVSRLALTGTGGSGNYRGVDLDGRFALGASDWHLTSGLSSARTDDTGSSARELRAGADLRADETLVLRGRGYRRDEAEGIIGTGAALGVDGDAELLADPMLATTLSLDLGVAAYRSDDDVPTASFRFARRAPTLTQASLGLGITQPLSRDWTLDLSAAWYRYSRDPAEMSAQLESRRQAATAISGLLPGLPRSSYGLGLQWSGLHRARLSAGAALSRTAVNSSTSVTWSTSAGYDVTPVVAAELGGAWTGDGAGFVQRQLTLGTTVRW